MFSQMKEIREIIRAYDAAVHAGKKSALAEVVHLEGSSYRRPGARMLVTDDGELTGAISGGCLEGDALRKAMLVLSQQQSKLVTYDTSDEDDVAIGIQLGCAGIIQVLFEPVDPNKMDNPIQLLRKAIAVRQHAVIVTLFSFQKKRNAQPGTCLLMESNGNITGSIPYPDLEGLIMQDVKISMQQEQSFFRQYEGNGIEVNAFIEFLKPQVSLVVVGAGNDAIPMMQIADTMGWDVRVIDGRNTHAKPERFVSACQVLVSKPETALERIPIEDQTVFVMMTHNYNYDKALLKSLLPSKVRYVGMLGPKKKLERMLGEIQEEGMKVDAEMLEKVYGPAGLEIGAETPEEIALSIIAEIKAVLEGKNGRSLRYKQEVIHFREETYIKEKKIY
jgi:xanthine/CO dehydrogenase XdhC/CoxF family maturation factor